MSSVATDDLYNDDETIDHVIEDIVKSVEERTLLRQKRSVAVQAKLQEMKDKKHKLEKQKLDRLASEGIYIDMDYIRIDIQKSRSINTDVQKDEHLKESSKNKSDNIDLDEEIKKNKADQKRLNNALENLQNFDQKQYDRDSKQTSIKRRSSTSTVSVGSRLSSEINKMGTGRRKSISHDGSGNTSKLTKTKRRNSLGGVIDKEKTTKPFKSTLKTIKNNEFKRAADKVKHGVKVK